MFQLSSSSSLTSVQPLCSKLALITNFVKSLFHMIVIAINGLGIFDGGNLYWPESKFASPLEWDVEEQDHEPVHRSPDK